MLRFRIGDIVVVCHFFTTTRLSSTLTLERLLPRRRRGLLGFLRRVGDTVGRVVILTYENDEQHPFISYDPSRREFEYHE